MRPKKVILLVDDDERDLSTLTFMLTTNGYRVLRANGGAQAIAALTGEDVDLVLTDFAMPGMNGIELIKRLKSIKSHIPMVLLGEPDKIADQLHQADALISKKRCTAVELLTELKLRCSRKRGPRKGVIYAKVVERHAKMLLKKGA